MKKLIYGLLAFAILAVVATTASTEPDPNLDPCPFAEAQVFEKVFPQTGNIEFQYWDWNGNLLGKERLNGTTGECIFDNYPGTCVTQYPMCDWV